LEGPAHGQGQIGPEDAGEHRAGFGSDAAVISLIGFHHSWIRAPPRAPSNTAMEPTRDLPLTHRGSSRTSAG
jgi:hypothetical protein